MEELKKLLEKHPDVVTVSKFPKLNESIFAALSTGLPAEVTASAREIIRGHIRAQARGRNPLWAGMRPSVDAGTWKAPHLVTAYYLLRNSPT